MAGSGLTLAAPPLRSDGLLIAAGAVRRRADGGGDQVQAARVQAGDGVAEADAVAGGEAGPMRTMHCSSGAGR